ncbi:hypothetical protein [Dactylosporangium sp. NPDC000521]|uniref:hypothetical protein n=1 Tax=Dactylosporangium sp. NPDC000521 TaxID=3363975 RepID=UPI0036C0ABFE
MYGLIPFVRDGAAAEYVTVPAGVLAARPTTVDHVAAGGTPVGLSILFAPTGPIQEVAISSGWGDAFLEPADRFDAAVAGEWVQAALSARKSSTKGSVRRSGPGSLAAASSPR